jgi:hypothetical protein
VYCVGEARGARSGWEETGKRGKYLPKPVFGKDSDPSSSSLLFHVVIKMGSVMLLTLKSFAQNAAELTIAELTFVHLMVCRVIS